MNYQHSSRNRKNNQREFPIGVVILGLVLVVIIWMSIYQPQFLTSLSVQPFSSFPKNGERQASTIDSAISPSSLNIKLDTKAPVPETPPPSPAAENMKVKEGDFYRYTDQEGIIHFVDDLDKVPPQNRQSMTVTRPSVPRSSVTPVAIKGNQVLVPVTLAFRGRSVNAQLLLDTGASVTTISERLASRLGIEGSDVRAGMATVADGRSVGSYLFVTDSLSVGSRSLPGVQASILSGSGGEGYDGLLGMNFLKNFRYHVDFSRSVIEWGG